MADGIVPKGRHRYASVVSKQVRPRPQSPKLGCCLDRCPRFLKECFVFSGTVRAIRAATSRSIFR